MVINMHPPLLTVIVAVFNGVATLKQCIDSVAQQTYPNKELIIIDGGSHDGTVDLLKAYSEQISYWVSEPDDGIYSAWNKGLAKAKGEWVCFLGADDYFWTEQVLERMSEELEKLPADIRVAYGQIMLLNEDGESLHTIGESWMRVKERFSQIMCIPQPGLMHRRSLFEQNGHFDESFRIAGDYELLFRELKTGNAMFIPNIITIGMRQGGVSSNPANACEAMREARRVHRMHGRRLPGWIWLMAVVKVYVRLLLSNSVGARRTRKLVDLRRRMKGSLP